jgi:hypothetical protein
VRSPASIRVDEPSGTDGLLEVRSEVRLLDTSGTLRSLGSMPKMGGEEAAEHCRKPSRG